MTKYEGVISYPMFNWMTAMKSTHCEGLLSQAVDVYSLQLLATFTVYNFSENHSETTVKHYFRCGDIS